jgi:hypothetical protein
LPQREILIKKVLSSPFVDSSLWLEGLGGSTDDLEAAGFYLRLPASSRPKISYLFDAIFYLELYPDVRAAGNDPFIHFIVHGCREGRSPHPLIDVSHIRSIDALLLPEFPTTLELYDVLQYNVADPSPYFSTEYYGEQLPGGPIDAVGLLEDFLKTGLLRGLKPNPLFDPLWYYRQLEG